MTIRRSETTAIFVAVMLGSLLSCQFQRRSAGYDCDSQDDCSGGRVCLGGWCVEGDGGQLADADPNAPDSTPGPDALFDCPDGCDRCDAGTCVIECALSDSCLEPVVCPAGADCRVECTGKNSCNGGIDCSAATDCLINCIGNDSCQAPITCGVPPCRVNCTETATCTMGIDCADSCKCDTVCSGTGACVVPPTCPEPLNQCTDSETGDCDSSSGMCHDDCPL